MSFKPRIYRVKRSSKDGSFGFRLLHRVGNNFMIFDHVKPNGAAWESGIRPGMHLLGINSKSILGKSISHVTGIIRRFSGDDLMLECRLGECDDIYANIEIESDSDSEVIEKKCSTSSSSSSTSKSSSDSSTSNQVQQVEPMVIPVFKESFQAPYTFQEFRPEDQPHPVVFHHLRKWPSSRGFGLAVSQDTEGLFTIIRVIVNHPAYCSSIRDGMILCKINEMSLTPDVQIEDVTEMIKQTGDEIRLMVITSDTDKWLKRCGRTIEDCLPLLNRLTYDPPPEIPLSELPED